MKFLVINCGSNKTKDIIKNVEKTGHKTNLIYLYKKGLVEHKEFQLDSSNEINDVQIVKLINNKIEIVHSLKDELKYVDGLILSGGGKLKNLSEGYLKVFECLKSIHMPILGICFGHQILALLDGAEIKLLEAQDTELRRINYSEKSTLFTGIPNGTKFQQNHSEYITLTNNFIKTSYSEVCPIEGIQHKSKPIFGVQFHPESSGKQGFKLINNFCKITDNIRLENIYNRLLFLFENGISKPDIEEAQNLLIDKGFSLKIKSSMSPSEAIQDSYLIQVQTKIKAQGFEFDLNDILDDLELLNIPYFSFEENSFNINDNKVFIGQVLVNKKLKEDLIEFFKIAFVNKFPFGLMKPLSDNMFWDEGYQEWSDMLSMKYNNTSSFNLRKIANKDKLSLHSYGLAIDFNPMLNPCIYCEDGGSQEPENAEYNESRIGTFTTDASLNPVGSLLTNFLISKGWTWGGNWTTLKDYHHFQKAIL